MFATKNLKARCDVARQPLWRYVKYRHRSCVDTWCFATNGNKKLNFFKLVAKQHLSSQLRWRYLTYRHGGCRATSSIGAHLVLVCLRATGGWYILCWRLSLFTWVKKINNGMVSDCGDQCLFIFLCCSHLYSMYFRFCVVKHTSLAISVAIGQEERIIWCSSTF